MYITIFQAEVLEARQDSCQEKSTSGRSYLGEVNTTVDGILCQKWSDTKPHDHEFSHVGDHNFCRNPNGSPHSQVWCFTTDPEISYQNCSVPFCAPLRALDFSLDNDQKPDENNSYTHASIQMENLPSSFTICTAFMIDSAHKESALLYVLEDKKGRKWHTLKFLPDKSFTEFLFMFKGSPQFRIPAKFLFYPEQWTRVCLSMNSNSSLVSLVVEETLLGEKAWRVEKKPSNLHLVLGLISKNEHSGRTTNFNIFSSALPVEQMMLQTSPGKKECGLAGDFLSWEKSLEEEQWTLHSKARWVDLDGGLEGPCREQGTMNIFPMIEGHHHTDCMNHCSKLGGSSPSLRTRKEWEKLLKGVRNVSPDPSRLLGRIWLSATEGDVDLQLGKLEHWPDGVKANESVWRDYYTGEQLENYTKPWVDSQKDTKRGGNYNCILFNPKLSEESSWQEKQCHQLDKLCPCTYDTTPLIRLRGFCPDTLVEHVRYRVKQSSSDPRKIVMVGYKSARIEYNISLSQWILSPS